MTEEEKQLPKLKRQLDAFLSSEQGQISKHAIVTLGAIAGTAVAGVIASKVAQAHPVTITTSGDSSGATVTATHNHGMYG